MRIAFVGDSFTEGLGDERADGTPRGWADRVAEGLAAALDEPVYCVNLAIRGRLLAPIVNDQLDAVLALDPPPDLILLNGGGNDMMSTRFSLDRVMTLTRRAIDKCRAAGIPLMLVSGATPADFLPLSSLMARRGTEYLNAVEELVTAEGTPLVSHWRDAELTKRPYWSVDRLHLGPLGHERVAANVLTHLGHPTPPPEPPQPLPRRTVAGEISYAVVHVAPFAGRALTGRSAGDGREAKYPDWTLVRPVVS